MNSRSLMGMHGREPFRERKSNTILKAELCVVKLHPIAIERGRPMSAMGQKRTYHQSAASSRFLARNYKAPRALDLKERMTCDLFGIAFFRAADKKGFC
jgi:hypothetical protein